MVEQEFADLKLPYWGQKAFFMSFYLCQIYNILILVSNLF